MDSLSQLKSALGIPNPSLQEVLGIPDKLKSALGINKPNIQTNSAPYPSQPLSKYGQLNEKNNVMADYGSDITPKMTNDIFGAKISDISNQSSLRNTKIGAQYVGNNNIQEVGKQPSGVLLHEELHSQFDKSSQTNDYKSSGDPYNGDGYWANQSIHPRDPQTFDEAYKNYLSKHQGESNKSIKYMNDIEKNYLSSDANDLYTTPGTSMQPAPSFGSATERFAYLGMRPDLIPKELKQFYTGIFK